MVSNFNCFRLFYFKAQNLIQVKVIGDEKSLENKQGSIKDIRSISCQNGFKSSMKRDISMENIHKYELDNKKEKPVFVLSEYQYIIISDFQSASTVSYIIL